MTEIVGVGMSSYCESAFEDDDAKCYEKTTKRGLTLPGFKFRVPDDEGAPVAWDDEGDGGAARSRGLVSIE